MSVTRSDIVAEARSYMAGNGTRWRHQGRTKYVGVDCIGVIGMSALALGVEGAAEWRATPEFHNYGPLPKSALLWSGCDRFMQRIPVHCADVGDVYVMAFDVHPQHFAIISSVNPTYVVHAYTSARRVVENGVNIARARILRAYRFRGVTA